jgi:hypothetical protein
MEFLVKGDSDTITLTLTVNSNKVYDVGIDYNKVLTRWNFRILTIRIVPMELIDCSTLI